MLGTNKENSTKLLLNGNMEAQYPEVSALSKTVRMSFHGKVSEVSIDALIVKHVHISLTSIVVFW